MAFHDNYIIDVEFAALLPVNDEETIQRLEAKLVKEGCIDPIRVWHGTNIVIDGMTRIVICRRLGIKFRVVEMEFEDRKEVKLWIIENQLARRDLTDTERKYYIGCVYNTRLENSKIGGLNNGCIRDQLAEEVGKSPATVSRLGEMAEALNAIGEVDKEIKDKILNEEIKPSLQEIKELSEEPSRRGRNRKVKAILDKKPATVSLGGDDEEDPQKVYDGLGNVVTDIRYHEVFVEIVTFNELLRDLRGCEARIKRLAGTAGGVALHADELTLTRVRSELDCRIPWCVCFTCRGAKTIVVDEKRNECPDCGGYGFMTKFNYERKMNKGKKKKKG